MNYNSRVEQELNNFRNLEQIHNLPPIRDYCASKYLYPRLYTLGFKGFRDMFLKYIQRTAAQIHGTLNIISVGSGNCDFEIELVTKIESVGIIDYRMVCIDINTTMLSRGKAYAERVNKAGKLDFITADFNKYIPGDVIHIAIANNSLHHVVELEHLFDGIKNALHHEGYFLINDMIGRNGHMRWPEAEFFLRMIWSTLDDKHRYNNQHKKKYDYFNNHDCSIEGFEGIRAQDILPLLLERFSFPFFFGFSNLISPLIGRSYGWNFDTEDPKDRAIIDSVATLDNCLIEAGVLKPTQMFAALSTTETEEPLYYKHMTPEFCMRSPYSDPPSRNLLLAARNKCAAFLPCALDGCNPGYEEKWRSSLDRLKTID